MFFQVTQQTLFDLGITMSYINMPDSEQLVSSETGSVKKFQKRDINHPKNYHKSYNAKNFQEIEERPLSNFFFTVNLFYNYIFT